MKHPCYLNFLRYQNKEITLDQMIALNNKLAGPVKIVEVSKHDIIKSAEKVFGVAASMPREKDEVPF